MKKIISFTIDETLLEIIKAAADADGRSMSNMVEYILREWSEKNSE